MSFRSVLGCCTVAASLCATAQATMAQENALSIELNDAADLEGGCRVTYVALNDTGVLLDKTSFEVFTFDAKAKVAQSLVFQFGRLPVGKTKVVQFDLTGQPCNSISRLLINDISECVVDGKPSTVCIDELKTTNTTSINFGM